MSEVYEVHALKYAERNARTRADSFLFDDDHAAPHAMDYFLWVLRSDRRTIVVDTGYDTDEARRRNRPILMDPPSALRLAGFDPDRIETVILTHLHYDHAGALDRFPAATFHLQSAEMAYATGPCMCHGTLRMPFTADHVCQMVRHVYSGRVVFHEGDAAVAPGVEVLAVGGHSRGLQAVRVMTARGPLVLASDTSHYYENFLTGKLFPIVVDVEAMLSGFERLRGFADRRELVIPGHDPLVRALFPLVRDDPSGVALHRLDAEPLRPLPSFAAE
ncbi:N-acyl homoserine lactonase family protein [Amorphus coralli]|uniref:N-acyl homoserine lactonase family protein n=1 Tax=Amorphus coralli TaxID=340680 RepID=UPI00036F0B24|nr:N-acyl homoserine lactonase family protein [Amorphus coralli]